MLLSVNGMKYHTTPIQLDSLEPLRYHLRVSMKKGKCRITMTAETHQFSQG